MDKKYLVGGIVCLVVGFAAGLAGGLMIASQSYGMNYAFKKRFDSTGFTVANSKELSGQIKEIKDSSVIISLSESRNAKDLRVKNTAEKEVVINEQSEIFVRAAKTEEDRYGVAAAKKIADLESQREKASSRTTRSQYAKLSEQISEIKRGAALALANESAELSKQIEALKPEETERLAELNRQLRALMVDYTLRPIKLTDLRVGEVVTVSNKKEIDLKSEIVAERLVVSR